METLNCPDCGRLTLVLIENTEPDGTGEYKEVRTCDQCENIVYIVRKTDTVTTLKLPSTHEAIVAFVKECHAKKVSKKDIAKKLGITVSTVNRYLRE